MEGELSQLNFVAMETSFLADAIESRSFGIKAAVRFAPLLRWEITHLMSPIVTKPNE